MGGARRPQLSEDAGARTPGRSPAAAPPPALLELQRSAGNQAVARLLAAPATVLARIVVQSDWLKIERPGEAPAAKGEAAAEEPKEAPPSRGEGAAGATKQEPMHEKFDISTSRSADGPWKPCTDKTSRQYRENAEKTLGPLAPLDVLAKWNVLPRGGGGGGSAWARSHLVAAEFGGQLTYRDPAQNIRFHPAELEWPIWQEYETRVKKSGRVGFITVKSSEARRARETAEDIVDVIRDQLDPDDVPGLEKHLAHELRAADYVSGQATFDWYDVEDPTSFSAEHTGLDRGLQVLPTAKPADVWGALHEIGVLEALKITAPEGVQIGPPETVIDSLDKLWQFVETIPAKPARHKAIKAAITGWGSRPAQRVDAKVAEQLAKLPEVKKMNVSISVRGFDGWFPTAAKNPEPS